MCHETVKIKIIVLYMVNKLFSILALGQVIIWKAQAKPQAFLLP